MRSTKTIGALLLALQLAWFVHEQLGATRYFCWAPLHEHVWYGIEAEVAGRPLSDDAIARRYGRRGAYHDARRAEFWELNTARHVIDSIAWREATLPAAERARVTLRYRIDDREVRVWTLTP